MNENGKLLLSFLAVQVKNGTWQAFAGPEHHRLLDGRHLPHAPFSGSDEKRRWFREHYGDEHGPASNGTMIGKWVGTLVVLLIGISILKYCTFVVNRCREYFNKKNN